MHKVEENLLVFGLSQKDSSTIRDSLNILCSALILILLNIKKNEKAFYDAVCYSLVIFFVKGPVAIKLKIFLLNLPNTPLTAGAIILLRAAL